MNSIKQLEEEKSSVFIKEKTINFIVRESKYKIKTTCQESFENQKSILIRKYTIPLLFGEKFISEIVNNYIKLVREVIYLQKSPVYLKSRVSKYFMR
jgi:hypothetical protein